jgi:O-antigen ligase
MKTLLIMLLVFGVLGILMVVGVLLLCAWDFYQATERTRRADVETFGLD